MKGVRLGRRIVLNMGGETFIFETKEGMEFTFQGGEIAETSITQPLKSTTDDVLPRLYSGFKYSELEEGENGYRARDEHGFLHTWIPADKGSGLLDVPEERERVIREDGGFWFPCNPASKGKDGLQFVEGDDILPIHDISPDDGQDALAELDTEAIGYRSFYEGEIICICEYLKLNGYSMKDSTKWGNYRNTPNREKGLAPIGSRKEARTKIGINDFAGTLWWTAKPRSKNSNVIAFGGACDNGGDSCPASESESFCSADKYGSLGIWGMPYEK